MSTFTGREESARLSILIFHRVRAEADPLFPEELDALRFERFGRLVKSWFQVLALDEAVRRLAAGTLPACALSITFDDGYADNCTIALPILRRLGLPASFFIAVGYLDGGRMWNDTVIESVRRHQRDQLDLARLGLGSYPTDAPVARRNSIDQLIARLKHLLPIEREQAANAIAEAAGVELPRDLMMTPDQVRELRRAGMGIGAHTVSHPILSRVSDDVARSEIAEGKARLEAAIGEPIELFAYPNGKPDVDYKPVHVRMARDLGFKAALTTAPGAARAGDDPYQLPRFTPWARQSWRQLVQFLGNLGRRDYPGAAT
ncbi:MAG: polysaccharide deacetylase family protein [Tepidisphaeraceae bacterium]